MEGKAFITRGSTITLCYAEVPFFISKHKLFVAFSPPATRKRYLVFYETPLWKNLKVERFENTTLYRFGVDAGELLNKTTGNVSSQSPSTSFKILIFLKYQLDIMFVHLKSVHCKIADSFKPIMYGIKPVHYYDCHMCTI